MGLSTPRNLFGIHSIILFNRTTKKPYGPLLKVLKSAGLDFAADFEDLTGGSEKFILASEPKNISSEFKFTTADYRDYLFELFAGATVTENAAEASGNVSTPTNKKGTSCINATTGIATVTAKAGSETDLKFAKLVIEVISATTVNILGLSDVDFTRGTDVDYQNDQLEILAVDLTIPDAGGTVDAPGLGITLTGGSGTVAMTVGDTAEFETRPINQGNSEIVIGQSNADFVEFGALLVAQKRSSGEMFEIELPRCVGAGLPLNFEEKVFSQAEMTVKVLKDFDLNRLATIRAIKP